MANRRFISRALTPLGGFVAVALMTNAQGQPALKDAYKNAFLIGAALNEAQFYGQNTGAVVLIKAQFNSISPENILKWQSIHPAPNSYNFEVADRYVAFGTKYRMFVIGHTLVWHHQTPEWVFQDDRGNAVDRETLLKRMRKHIFTVVGRYKGRVRGWDVVNEALNDDGSLRQSPWLKIIGADYLLKAYQFAHEADPKAELYYNDYLLENEAKRNSAIELVKMLKAQGVPITAVGLQGHYNMDWPPPELIDATIAAFAKLGVKVMFTELDMDVLPPVNKNLGADNNQNYEMWKELNPYTNGLPDEIQQRLSKRYADLFAVFLKHRDVITRVTFWGVTDGDSWLNYTPLKGRTAYPLLFDRNYGTKPAFFAVIEAARQAKVGK